VTEDGRKIGLAVAYGIVAAMAMTGMRRVTVGLGLVQQPPPEEIAERGVPGLLAMIPADLRNEAIELAHWGYGALAGGIFGLLPAWARRGRWAGPAYGLATWAAFERAVAPLFGLKQPEERPVVERAMIAADHILFGLIVAARPERPD
jgi:hypothetical protein